MNRECIDAILANKYKNICLNISDFTDILTYRLVNEEIVFDPIIDRITLMSGFYGTLSNGTKVWISKYVQPGHFRISNDEIIKINCNQDLNLIDNWTIDIPNKYINEVQRYLEMKAFW